MLIREKEIRQKNKGNFTATLIRFNQNLNYEKIYVFQDKDMGEFQIMQIFMTLFF